MHLATKEELKNIIIASSVPAFFPLDQLQHLFGFERMDGLELSLRKTVSGRSEESLQSSSKYDTIKKIEIWSKTEGIFCSYDHIKDGLSFYFDRYQNSKSKFE